MKQFALMIGVMAALPTIADEIEVRGRPTPLDVSNTTLVQQECKPSMCIGNVYYDAANQYLVFDARGTYYHRCGVPADVVSEWVNSNNLKRYYEKKIKPDYNCAGKPLPY